MDGSSLLGVRESGALLLLRLPRDPPLRRLRPPSLLLLLPRPPSLLLLLLLLLTMLLLPADRPRDSCASAEERRGG